MYVLSVEEKGRREEGGEKERKIVCEAGFPLTRPGEGELHRVHSETQS